MVTEEPYFVTAPFIIRTDRREKLLCFFSVNNDPTVVFCSIDIVIDTKIDGICLIWVTDKRPDGLVIHIDKGTLFCFVINRKSIFRFEELIRNTF